MLLRSSRFVPVSLCFDFTAKMRLNAYVWRSKPIDKIFFLLAKIKRKPTFYLGRLLGRDPI